MAWDHIYSCLSKINHVIYGQGGPEPDIHGAGLWAAGLLGPDPAESGPGPYIKWFILDEPLYIWPGTIYTVVYLR